MGQNFLVDQFLKGGPMMWALLLCSLVALGIVIDRMWHLLRVPSEEQAEQELDAAEDVLKNQGEKGAVEHFRQGSGVLNFIFAALVKRYDVLVLENRTDLEDMRQELIEATQEAGDIFLGRLLNALGTIGVLSPLMGLLGTILGMIRAFDAIARSGAGGQRHLGGADHDGQWPHRGDSHDRLPPLSFGSRGKGVPERRAVRPHLCQFPAGALSGSAAGVEETGGGHEESKRARQGHFSEQR